MLIRLALEDECEVVVAMVADAVAETQTGHVFNPDRVREVFASYLATAHPTFFLAEQRRTVIGFLQAEMGVYDFTDGLFTVQKTLYVRPERRGTRAAAALVEHMIGWSRMLGAKEILGGVDNGFQIDRTEKFLARFGFRNVGCAMTLRLVDGKEE